MNYPSVSIIIPVYNVEHYVEECINSVVHQTYDGAIECIVVDDGCTDNSMIKVEKIIADYKGHITFIVLHHSYNRGVSTARNTGIEKATGDYLFFLDSDDYLSDVCLERLTEPIKDYMYDLVIGNYQHVDESGIPINSDYIIKVPDNTLLLKDEILQVYSNGKIKPVVWGRLVLSRFVHENKLLFKEDIIYEDELWNYKVFCLAESLFVVNQKLYFYKHRNGSITSSRTDKSIISLVAIVVEMCTFMRSIKIFNEALYISQRRLFYKALSFDSSASVFFHSYKLMHQQIQPSIINYTKVNWKEPKRFIRDIHLLFPSYIAPYCEYSIRRLLTAIRQIY